MPIPPVSRQESKRVLAGVLGILLGCIGAHRFALGDPLGGLLRLLITSLTVGVVGSLLGLVEGILYLSKSDAEFVRIYQVEGKKWF